MKKRIGIFGSLILLLIFIIAYTRHPQIQSEPDAITDVHALADITFPIYHEYVNPGREEEVFERLQNANIIGNSSEYYPLASEREKSVAYFGMKERVGNLKGYPEQKEHLLSSYMVGLFSLINDENEDFLILVPPDDEWFYFYQKVGSMPLFDIENCIRFEFIYNYDSNVDIKHSYCGEGLTEPELIEQFISEMLSQDKINQEVMDIYNKSKKKNYGYIIGFFPDNYAAMLQFPVYQYDENNYTMQLPDENEVLLDSKWLELFKPGKH